MENLQANLQQCDPAIPFRTACSGLGVSRASVYRGLPAPSSRKPRRRRASRRRLSDLERRAVLDVLDSERFADHPPRHRLAWRDGPTANVGKLGKRVSKDHQVAGCATVQVALDGSARQCGRAPLGDRIR